MEQFLIAIGILIAASYPALIVISCLTWFYTRGNYPQLATRVFTWNWQKEYIDAYNGYTEDDEMFAFGIWLTTFCIYSAIAAGFYRLYEIYGIVGISTLCIGVVLLIAPRYILDVCKSLKYNTKTRDSDRLVKLEKQIEELRNK
jgi:hypothetical protein